MSNLETVKRFRDALQINVEKIAKYHNEDEKDWLNYITNYVEKRHGLLIPVEFYRLMYNKSVEILQEI